MATPVRVQLSLDQVRESLRLADASFTKNARRRGSAEHYANTPKSHKVGKMGEMACALAFRDKNIAVDDAYRDPIRERQADIVAGEWRIEVKTWSDYAWIRGGRCVKPEQLPDIRAKADCVVWCSICGQLEEGRVLVQGWSTISEIAQTKPRWTEVGQHRVLNHQVEVDDVRDFTDLVAAIMQGPPAVT